MPRHSGLLFVAGAIGCLTLVGIGGFDFASSSPNAMDAGPTGIPPTPPRVAPAAPAAPLPAQSPAAQAPMAAPAAAVLSSPWTQPSPRSRRRPATAITSPESALVHAAAPRPAPGRQPVVSAGSPPPVRVIIPPAVRAATPAVVQAGTPPVAPAGTPGATRDAPLRADAPDDSTPTTTSAPAVHGYPFSAHF